MCVQSDDIGLTNDGKPGAISQWERRQRRLTGPWPIPDPLDFGHRWRTWVTSLMPDWRKRNPKEWPLPREVPLGERWESIRKGGRDGILLLLMSLSWWKNATHEGSVARDEYESALEELAWLLQQLIAVSPSSPPIVPASPPPSLLPSGVVHPLLPITSITSQRELRQVPSSIANQVPPAPDASPPGSRVTQSKALLPAGPVTRRRAAPASTPDRANKRIRTRR